MNPTFNPRQPLPCASQDKHGRFSGLAGFFNLRGKSEMKANHETTIPQNSTRVATSARHTPGPWKAVIATKGMAPIYGSDETIQNGEPYQIGWIIMEERNLTARKTDVANANLIAAAPELLEQLKIAERFMRGFEDDLSQGIGPELTDIRAAIRRAEGRAQ